MGRASSSKKVNRAASTGGGRTGRGRTPWGWYGSMGLVVLLGIMLVVVSRADRQNVAGADEPPRGGDHWHAAYGIYLCDTFIPPLADKSATHVLGIHSHEDGLIHIHPTSRRAMGKNARLKLFMDQVGASVGTDEIKLPGKGSSRKDGDKCGGKKGAVKVMVWDNPADETGEEVAGDPGELLLGENQIITIGFVPEGEELRKPPSVGSLAAPSDMQPSTTLPGNETPTPSSPSTTTGGSTTGGSTATTTGGTTSTSGP